MRNTLIFCGFLLTLAACGTKGPLTLPPAPPAPQTDAPSVRALVPADNSTAPGGSR